MNNRKPSVVIVDDYDSKYGRQRTIHDVVEYHARIDNSHVHHFEVSLAVEGRSTKASQQPRDEYTSWLLQHWLPWANLEY